MLDATSAVAPFAGFRVPEDALRRGSVVVFLLQEVDEDGNVQRRAHEFVVVKDVQAKWNIKKLSHQHTPKHRRIVSVFKDYPKSYAF